MAQKIGWVKWSGILLVIAGLVTVGLTDHFYPEEAKDEADTSTKITQALVDSASSHATDMVIGDALIIFAQVIVAFQVVYEEKFITKYNVSCSLNSCSVVNLSNRIGSSNIFGEVRGHPSIT